MNTTLTNSFHDTKTVVRVTVEQANDPSFDWVECQTDIIYRGTPAESAAAKRRLHRAWRDLCGCKGCTCGMVR